MRRILLIFTAYLLQFLNSGSYAQTTLDKSVNWQKLNNSHDLFLSPWGPYSKKYAGISHIPEFKSGIRFDFSVITGLYRYKPVIPNVLLHSDYYPWESNNDLTRYVFRSEMAWKDDAYADVEYNIVDSNTVLVAIHCVNNTSLPQNMDINLMAYLDYPENYPEKTINSSDNVLWTNAVDYKSLDLATKGPRHNLIYDGWIEGEVRNSEYINGRAIGKLFGQSAGNKITYNITLNKNQLSGSISLLYRMPANKQSAFLISGLANQKANLKGTGKFEQVVIPYTAQKPGSHSITFEAEGAPDIEFNGFSISQDNQPPQFSILERNFKPEVTEDLIGKSVILKYPEFDKYYGINWEFDDARVREFRNDELDIYLRRHFNNHTSKVFTGNNKGNFTNVYIRPIELDANDEKTIYAMVVTGSYNQVKKRLSELKDARAAALEKKNRELNAMPKILPEGEKHEFGQKIMRTTLLTNILYPIYTQDSYIRHFTPGKWYTSLYTWDSGFTALGLNEINTKMAIENINAYTTSSDNQNAFIQHGTPVPVQIYAFYDLWNKTQSKEMLTYFYPRLKKYYEFMAGRFGSSTTRNLKSNMLRTFDYFYNSGGWDDYPAQMTVHELKATKTVAPVANTAHSIRLAKMLKLAAQALGEKKDIVKYDDDIKVFTGGLQKYSWNDTTGYFSYVVHDNNGNPVGRLKDPISKQDHNMGLDGAYPLFAGICTPEQEAGLLDKIFSEKHMWTPTGICVVDQAAPYFKPVGYWNGSVWMPHQWFTWKAMLDLGRADLAHKIAEKALDVYKREVDASYSTFEYYSAKTGRGAGWHQFAGLTAPVINWFSSYYKPGTVTTGFEIWIDKQSFNTDLSSYKGNYSFDQSTPPHHRSLLICMNPAYAYKVSFNGKTIEADNPYPGMLQITLPATNKDASLIITPIKQ